MDESRDVSLRVNNIASDDRNPPLDMATSTESLAGVFVARARKIYRPIGFSKGYNFVLWFVFAGGFFGFILARLEYLDVWGKFCVDNPTITSGAIPGECFYYQAPGRNRIGIFLHLACMLPGGLLMLVQFIPVVRHKLITLHRINGYLVILLSVLGTAGAIMIARNAVGGGLDVQTAVGLLAIMFIGALGMAMFNIKRLQVEQHRAWMLRAWFYACVIVTFRFSLYFGALAVSSIGGYYMAQPCDKINFTLGGEQATLSAYPGCAPFFSGETPDQHVVVLANYNSEDQMQIATAFNTVFGMSAWICIALHAIGVEVYLHLTPAEHERLRNMSYQRQLEAGMRNPGRSGLTVDRIGDTERWSPKPLDGNIDRGKPSTRANLSSQSSINNS
ncbi:hypothetical protein F4810DRAFT_670774 [Camillea tinctor]|nr:hypothetical protein F4810DRAFT_670774 [Camillea tinctor]